MQTFELLQLLDLATAGAARAPDRARVLVCYNFEMAMSKKNIEAYIFVEKVRFRKQKVRQSY